MDDPNPQKTVARRRKSGVGARYVVLLFYAAFAVFGTFGIWKFGVQPIRVAWRAQGWTATPCTILSSAVEKSPGGKDTTYSVRITYEYEFHYRKYVSDNYNGVTVSSSGRRGKARIVAAFTPGSEKTCYVNPDNPSEAVLYRGWDNDFLWGLLPLLFTAIGCGGMFRSLRFLFRPTPDAISERTDAVTYPPLPASRELTLKSRSRIARVMVCLFVAVFWNGIVSLFIVSIVEEWRKGNHQWGESLFMGLFAAFGLYLIGVTLHSILAMFTPKPALVVTPAALAPGQEFLIEWRLTGRIGSVTRLRLRLEGRGEIRRSSGDADSTREKVFHTADLTDTADPVQIRYGRVLAAIPEGALHSFESDCGAAIWSIHVHGTIPYWSDVQDEFELPVRPQTA